jgi:hypothetical protein
VEAYCSASATFDTPNSRQKQRLEGADGGPQGGAPAERRPHAARQPSPDFIPKRTIIRWRCRRSMPASLAAFETLPPLLAKFDEGAKQVRDLTEKVCADGTVTKDEAKSVRELARSLRPHHKKGEKGEKGKEARRDRREHRKHAA